MLVAHARVAHLLSAASFSPIPSLSSGETIRQYGRGQHAEGGLRLRLVGADFQEEGNLTLEELLHQPASAAPLYKMFFEDYTEKVWGVQSRFQFAAGLGRAAREGPFAFQGALDDGDKSPLPAAATARTSRPRSSSSSSIRKRDPASFGRRWRMRSSQPRRA